MLGKKLKKSGEEKPKTISDDNFKKAARFVDASLEPKIRDMIEAANNVLNPKGIRIGAEIKWFFDEIKTEKESE